MGVGYIPPRDNSGRPITKRAITESGWHMHNVFIEVCTSTLAVDGLKDQKKDGTSRGIASLKFYDNNDVELIANTQAELDANCVKTIMEVNFPFDFELQGGRFYCPGATNDVYFWATVAPHIPQNQGGSVEFVSQANLKETKEFIIDGRAPKLIKNDDVNLSDKWEFVMKHNAGIKEKITLCYEAYKEPTSEY